MLNTMILTHGLCCHTYTLNFTVRVFFIQNERGGMIDVKSFTNHERIKGE